MNLFFEEAGDFKVGAILSQQGEAYQVETPSGKRTKVRARDVLLQFASPTPSELMSLASDLAKDMDTAFLWEVAGEQEFDFADLGMEYFGHKPEPQEAAGLLMKLSTAPIYFYKKGKGRYKAAPQASLQAALLGLEKKKQQAILQATYVEELKAGKLPASMASMMPQLLFKPDKNTIEYKALEAACTALQTTPARLMLTVGAIPNTLQLHFSKFLLEQFPKGRGFPAITLPSAPELPMASVQAFSIDDVTTTEIDDAFSVQHLSDGDICIGIHIAAPALAIQRDDAIDVIARSRMSTVYMPGDKITMLPDEFVNLFTLAEGLPRPALSLYVTLNKDDWSVRSTKTVIEQVPVAANLRHNDLDDLVTEEALQNGEGDYPFKNEISVLWQWAQVLEQGRMKKREEFGLRPEQNNRVDFNFYVEDETVTITRRKRGAPLDKIVAELMIFANSSWGKLMHECGVPGIYRAQGGGNGWSSRLQVRMQTHAAPHQGLGVDQYAWSTSPLRRYTDLVNQWQIMACVSHAVTAPLVAPFKPKDADLFAIVSAFDGAYAAYADFQNTMERYWCLRWLKQESQRQESQRNVDAVVLKDEMLRLTEIPLVIQMPSLPTLARGSQVKLELLGSDEVDLSVQARLLEVVKSELANDESELADEEAEEKVTENISENLNQDEQVTQNPSAEVHATSPVNTE